MREHCIRGSQVVSPLPCSLFTCTAFRVRWTVLPCSVPTVRRPKVRCVDRVIGCADRVFSDVLTESRVEQVGTGVERRASGNRRGPRQTTHGEASSSCSVVGFDWFRFVLVSVSILTFLMFLVFLLLLSVVVVVVKVVLLSRV